MSKRKLLSAFGLKWNPFAPDLPVEALRVTPEIERFLWRVDELATDGGFATICGEPGTGKSVVLRLIEHRFTGVRDVNVAVLARPQSGVADFYRELGEAFGATISTSNRWGGFKVLREKWRAKLESSLRRPVILIDEAQEMLPPVLSELRLLASDRFDSHSLLTVILAGDQRLTEKLRLDELVPLGSRIRTRLTLEPMSPDQALDCLEHAVQAAGNPQLMTKDLMVALAEHGFGNYRALMNLAGEVLMAGLAADKDQLDDKLFLELYGAGPSASAPRKSKRKAAARSR